MRTVTTPAPAAPAAPAANTVLMKKNIEDARLVLLSIRLLIDSQP